MKRSIGHALLLMVAGTAMVQAQDVRVRTPRPTINPTEAWVRTGGRIVMPMGVGSIENILRRKEDLKLTDQQATQMEALRRDEVARRQNEARDLIDLQSRAAAGLIERTTFRDEMEKVEDAQRAGARNVRNRLEQILTDEQRDQLPLLRFPMEACCGFRTMINDRTFPFDGSNWNWNWDWDWNRALNWDRSRLDLLRNRRSGGIL
ncbi:MAG: hypothetical protein ACRENP_29640 [Longimicrobiales bacterium]